MNQETAHYLASPLACKARYMDQLGGTSCNNKSDYMKGYHSLNFRRNLIFKILLDKFNSLTTYVNMTG